MCNLCSINHFTDDDFDDEYDEHEPSLCVHHANHAINLNEQDLSTQEFRPTGFISAGSSF